MKKNISMKVPRIKKAIIVTLAIVALAAPWHYTLRTQYVTPPAPHHGYPELLANAPLDSLLGPWNAPNRECTSYVAYRLYKAYGFNDTTSWGDAKNWGAAAALVGLRVDHTPAKGSVIFFTYEPHGHVAFVESVDVATNRVHVSQYNKQGKGEYSEADLNYENLVFIHFEDLLNG
jgi:hypothetical protein